MNDYTDHSKGIDEGNDFREQYGPHPLPVLLGEKISCYATLLMFLAEYVIIIWQVISGYFTIALLLILLALPAFIKMVPVFMKPRLVDKPEEYPEDAWQLWFVGFSFVYTRQWGGLFLLGLIIDTIVKVFFLK